LLSLIVALLALAAAVLTGIIGYALDRSADSDHTPGDLEKVARRS